MAKGIAHASGGSAIEHVCGWLDFLRTRLDRAPQQCSVVIQKDVEAGSAAPSARGSLYNLLSGSPIMTTEPAIKLATGR